MTEKKIKITFSCYYLTEQDIEDMSLRLQELDTDAYTEIGWCSFLEPTEEVIWLKE